MAARPVRLVTQPDDMLQCIRCTTQHEVQFMGCQGLLLEAYLQIVICSCNSPLFSHQTGKSAHVAEVTMSAFDMVYSQLETILTL
jgi:hypothetical protein